VTKLINILIGISTTLTLFSCSQMQKKSVKLAWNEVFYSMDMEKKGYIYRLDCKNRIKGRECEKEERNLIDEWSKFSPTFIVLPYKLYVP